MLSFPRQFVIDALEEMGEDPEESIRDDYSGRGMYGTTCAGLVLDSSALIFMVQLGAVISRELTDDDEREDMMNALINMTDKAQTDSMGRYSQIVYFPGWEFMEMDPADAG